MLLVLFLTRRSGGIAEPPSRVDLRRRLEGTLPRFDLPDRILEVMAWHPAFVAACRR